MPQTGPSYTLPRRDLNHHPQSGDFDPPLRLDEGLERLHPALPHGFGSCPAVVAKTHRDVQGYYRADPSA